MCIKLIRRIKMAVYVDKAIWEWKGKLWCHLAADSLSELHNFADTIGANRNWFQYPPKTKYPHYDLPEFRRDIALANGAVVIGRREMISKVKILLTEYQKT